MSHPFDERGIALPPDDVLVDAPRLAGVHRLARHELAVDRQFQVAERSVLRQRKHVVRLADRAAAIEEPFLHLVSEHTVSQLDAYVAPSTHDLLSDRQRPRTVHDRLANPAGATRNDDPLGGQARRQECDPEHSEYTHGILGLLTYRRRQPDPALHTPSGDAPDKSASGMQVMSGTGRHSNRAGTPNSWRRHDRRSR